MDTIDHDSQARKADTPSPLYLTQHTALGILGLTSRQFRTIINRHGIRHTRLGKLILVRLADWDEAMAALSRSGQQPRSTEAMLAAVLAGRAGGMP